MTPEQKFAKTITDGLNRLDIGMPMVALNLAHDLEQDQAARFTELIVIFLVHYALQGNRADRPGDQVYTLASNLIFENPTFGYVYNQALEARK